MWIKTKLLEEWENDLLIARVNNIEKVWILNTKSKYGEKVVKKIGVHEMKFLQKSDLFLEKNQNL